jgi:hypothetical protein
MTIEPAIIGRDHVQLAMPQGEESRAREFSAGVLGLVEEPGRPTRSATGLS